MTWDEIKNSWSDGWSALWTDAQQRWRALVEQSPVTYKPKVEAFVSALDETRAALERMKSGLASLPDGPEVRALQARRSALEQRYHELAAGFYSETSSMATPSVGWIPVLVVGGLALSAAAAAWAVPGYEYAVNLREQTLLATRELDARIAASKDGRTLQATTLPAPPPPPPTPLEAAKGLGSVVLFGLVAVAGVVALPALIKK